MHELRTPKVWLYTPTLVKFKNNMTYLYVEVGSGKATTPAVFKMKIFWDMTSCQLVVTDVSANYYPTITVKQSMKRSHA
jgi:hypothetical protein